MKSSHDIIMERNSCRTFDGNPLNPGERAAVNALLSPEHRGPFGNRVRLKLIDLDQSERDELRALGTYGMIHGARLFIAGAVANQPRAMVDYGYCLEKVILELTGMDLGTCWLGGTFNHSGVAKKFGLTEGELLPAVTPLGHPAARRSFMDSAVRTFAGSKHRKPWPELFFMGGFTAPLIENEAGGYTKSLEAVRMAPSASNKQPWRVVRDRAGFHFFLERTPGYDKLGGKISFQEIDLGIALCHFELVTQESKLPGGWRNEPPGFEAGGREYILSWMV